MTKTMAEATISLAEIIRAVLTERNKAVDLCLSPNDMATAIQLACADENIVRLVALGGLGSMLYEALEEWLLNYERQRQRWLSETPPGRRVLKERAPEVFERVMRYRREHEAAVKLARSNRRRA